ncbi:MAG TPA: polymer-forming cytoskeletal protein [Gammaproteobacteria bacterium]|nr:polymer-forming cytoskeletal protein [Gammaproteobacteria bacterium]
MIGRGKSRKKSRSARVDTVIGKTTSVKGDLSFAGTLHVEGTIIGNVRSENDEASTLILDEDGLIQGDVDVANIIVNGAIEGDIFARGHAELLAKARIKGTVYYNLIEMAVGSEVNGNLVHRSEEPMASVEYLETGQSGEQG